MLPNIQSLSEQGEFDAGPGRFRIGLLVLSNDYVMERDFINMRPSDEVSLFVSRLPNTPDCTVETLGQMAPHITGSTALLVPEGRLDVIAYGCTSGTAVLGYEEIRARVHQARPEIALTTPLTASLAALDCFGAQRLSVLTPYVDNVNRVIGRYLEDHGKTVVHFSSFHLAENEAMAKLSPDCIARTAMAMDMSDADALFISCTAIRAVDVVDRIEQSLGKPVVTAVQAIVWQSMRLAGCEQLVDGYGRLLRNDFGA